MGGKLYPFRETCLASTQERVKLIALEEIKKNDPTLWESPEQWEASLRDSKWIVSPKLPPGTVGGDPTAEVDEKSGEAIKMDFAFTDIRKPFAQGRQHVIDGVEV